MEIFELRYFLGVAKQENIHRASESLNVSPGSLSKAISRLESELQVKLFSREGRNIRLTDHGRQFQRRASEIVQLEETARLELSGQEGSIHIVLTGAEILLSEMGMQISAELQRKFPKCTFEFHSSNDESAIQQLSRGESHLALVTQEPAAHLGLSSKVVADVHFQTVVGERHPLFKLAKAKKTIPVERILEFPFVSPNHPLLGRVGLKQSLDGWRDDEFPRRIDFLTSSLKLLEEFVAQGRAIAYLPDYYAERIGAEVLKISGCPYSCTQKVRLVAKNPKDRSWLNYLF